ncbi:uncharacterized protein LOC101897768 [Musca domestica]|uniref:Uncharacterized protein LOC101897768 n=1 Tax=Musca domestica TaxID=7370 RepID=A0A1I8N633_MUSDO|nr:uncharacterized protein LOC101897768 [Musca domestica]
MEVENSIAERKPMNVPTNAMKRASLNPSLASSTVENVIYPPSHQYHYIQYYQQPAINQYANPILQPTCQCSCSCGTAMQQQQQQMLQQQQQQHQQMSQHSPHSPNNATNRGLHSHQNSIDAAVIVHRQASGSNSSSEPPTISNSSDLPQKSQSETSLLNHSYQALKVSESLNENLLDTSPKILKSQASSCDCDLECTCGRAEEGGKANVNRDATSIDNEDLTSSSSPNSKDQMKQFVLSEAMLTADEITVSESDNNSSTVKRCERNKNKKSCGLSHKSSSIADDLNYHNANNIDIYCDGDAEAITEACLKETNGVPGANSDLRPPLPPRPPPRPKTATGSLNSARGRPGMVIKKYVVWCLVCGGFSCILGLLFLGVYFLLHSYTITVGNFETVPTFVPATLLILTGLCVMSLARRRNRYSYLIKLSGACGLISALTCALVTVTTTVLHMSRLQALRECEYAQKTRTCTCYSDMIESQVDRVDKEGVRLVFDSLSDCGVVHGSLYSCLRAIFGLSVAGVLVAVFSCMLVYQLLSHERKKMYWEQLELRCRSLYTRPQMPPQNIAAAAAPHGCRCCEQCHAHRQVPLQATAYPWDESSEPRFWSTQPPGNFYSPNPGGDDLMGLTNTCRRHEITTGRGRGSGWSWNRWWQRSSPDPNSRFRQTPSSPDSQYGFSNSNVLAANALGEDVNAVVANGGNPQQFNVLSGNLPYGVWGPPPPYSDPNSPARRGYYQYIQPPHHHASNNANGNPSTGVPMVNPNITEQPNTGFMEQPGASNCCQQNSIARSSASTVGSVSNFKSKVEYENTPSDSDCGGNLRERDRFSNTLPTRKIKKRLDPGNKSIGPNSQSAQRVNVQQVFSANAQHCGNGEEEQEYHEPQILGEDVPQTGQPQHQQQQLNKCGVENSAFQNSCESTNTATQQIEQQAGESSDPTESEVYFADVSSCCNMSVKNDHYYEDTRASQRTLIPPNGNHPHTHPHNHTHHHHQHQLSNCSSSTNEDYLAQRFGPRENSIRSRLPFPQNAHGNEGFVENLKILGGPNKEAHIPKDPSCQSMCSVESEAKTEFTDLSPMTPCGQKLNQLNDFGEITNQGQTTPTNFVASYPYSSESQSLEAHRRSTKNLTEAHYEVIDDQQPPSQQQQQQPQQQVPSVVNRSVARTAGNNKPRTPQKPARKDNSDREWSDNSNSDRNRL